MTDQIIADRARAAKAQALVAVLAPAGATSASITHLDDDGLQWAAQAAGVRPPSQRTRQLVGFGLAERERPVDDPFASPRRRPDGGGVVTRVDLDRLTDDQRQGLACVGCGERAGRMRPIATPDNPQSTHVFVHVDDCDAKAGGRR